MKDITDDDNDDTGRWIEEEKKNFSFWFKRFLVFTLDQKKKKLK